MKQQKGTMKELIVTSHFLNEEIELMVYLPANFSPLYKYQLLITQDGQDYFSLGKIQTVVEEQIQAGNINPTIIIGIPYKNAQDRWNKYHPDGLLHEQYIRFLGEELLSILDEEFPTFQVGSSRILIGDSLGATISLLTALSYPNSFGKVILQSPFVNDLIIKKVLEFNTPYLVEVYHTIGTDESDVTTTHGEVINFVDPNRTLHQAFKQKNYIYFYNEDTGNHTWTYWQPALQTILKRMLSS
ncbi:alpha/beta hydrolase [Bacillus sp. PS06]|uniref:alpha/beta hydrolase n=1 Tax=Bacillus sp. PS06 TaxID=2764176 RepID=UPI001783BD4E|nr:alpha/beta hydrolase-fold protein [Bacillus sp. PS06]MBD8067482.1 esterase family protein [Bacillus sp. PS06]